MHNLNFLQDVKKKENVTFVIILNPDVTWNSFVLKNVVSTKPYVEVCASIAYGLEV